LAPVIDIKSFIQMIDLAWVGYDNFKTNYYYYFLN